MQNDGDDGEPDARECTTCGVRAPVTQTNYTLISASHGWRLTARFTRQGERIAEWRCPTCWVAYRNSGGKLRETK
jgi:hypothetical protein